MVQVVWELIESSHIWLALRCPISPSVFGAKDLSNHGPVDGFKADSAQSYSNPE